MTVLPEPRDWELEVVEVLDLSPGMRRIRLTGEGIGGLDYLPGQDMAIAVPAPGVPGYDAGDADGPTPTVRRRYTIAGHDADRAFVDLDFVMHGDGPAARWAATARPGTRTSAVAPRGKIILQEDVDWHLFAGDETAVPGVTAMVGALPPGCRALVYLEVGDPADEREIAAARGVAVDIRWLARGSGVGPGLGTGLADALEAAELPDGSRHAYLAGEFGTVQAIRRMLQGRGLAPEEISPKPYWRLGRRNMPHGEPERD